MIDRLIERIDELKNPTVVGLDPTFEMIPNHIKQTMFERYENTPKAVSQMFLQFNMGIIDAISDLVPAVKPQIAMYERYGLDGIVAYMQTIAYAKSKGMLIIGDIKRGDIASTAEAYAAHLSGVEVEGERFDLWQEDAVTLNPYLGTDSVDPFLKACDEYDKSIFMLVKTSNPSGKEIQDLIVEGKPLYLHVAQLVNQWGRTSVGKYGYSKVGAVVGATYSEQGELLRKVIPNTFFLVPGYGAQGATAADLKGYFDKDGKGCIINSSRGIIAAYKQSDKYSEENYGEAAREAVITMKTTLGEIC